MKAYPKLSQLFGACVVQCMPLFLQAQVSVNHPSVQPIPHPQVSEEANTPMQIRRESQRFSALPRVSFVHERALDVLDFWFGDLPGPEYFPQDRMTVWFTGSLETDRQIRENFSQDILSAMQGDYNSWRETPRGRLALILLLDQFPRHVYRNRPQEFMADRMARALALEGLQKGDDKQLYPMERVFFYLPFEHAEDLQLQNLSVSSYRKLLAQAPMEIKPQMQAILHYAILHQRQIARFGRFPHRNIILDRESYPEEIVFLRQWGRPSF